MKKFFLYLFLIIPLYSFADDRPIAVMQEDDIFDIRYNINNLEKMVNDKNLDGFLECFTNTQRKKIKKQTAITFAKFDTSMDITSIYVIDENKNTGEVVVNYTTTINNVKYKMVSLVSMKKENNYWKISSEKIKGLEIEVPRLCSPSRYGMIAGRMRLLSPPEY